MGGRFRAAEVGSVKTMYSPFGSTGVIGSADRLDAARTVGITISSDPPFA
jgi:hypothetical protein